MELACRRWSRQASFVVVAALDDRRRASPSSPSRAARSRRARGAGCACRTARAVGERAAARAGADDDHVVAFHSSLLSLRLRSPSPRCEKLATAGRQRFIAAKDAALAHPVLQLRAAHARRPAHAQVDLGREQHAERRRGEVDPQRGEVACAGRGAERARGFMLIPEIGSTLSRFKRTFSFSASSISFAFCSSAAMCGARSLVSSSRKERTSYSIKERSAHVSHNLFNFFVEIAEIQLLGSCFQLVDFRLNRNT